MFNFLKQQFTVYKTTKIVPVKSKFLAITYFALIVTVWTCYLGSYELDPRKMYEKICKASGPVTAKTKGALSTQHLTAEELGVTQPELYQSVWDESDLVFISQGGSGGFFIATNLLITPNQTRSTCPEEPDVLSASCANDSDCQEGFFPHGGHGVLTGMCVNETKTCEVSAWCPIENDTLPFNGKRALLEDTKSFTIMLKHSVEFPDCGPNYRRRNILTNTTKKYLRSCIHDRENDPHCPIFKIGDIVEWSNQNFSKVAITGGVFEVVISWNCNFDQLTIDDCYPTYLFSRLDEENALVSPGWNFRIPRYHGHGLTRTVTKYFGLKIIVAIQGEGKCFDFLTFVLTIGATIGFFSVAPLVCDLLLDLCSKLKKFYPFSLCLSQYSAGARVDGHKQQYRMNAESVAKLVSAPLGFK